MASPASVEKLPAPGQIEGKFIFFILSVVRTQPTFAQMEEEKKSADDEQKSNQKFEVIFPRARARHTDWVKNCKLENKCNQHNSANSLYPSIALCTYSFAFIWLKEGQN